MLCDQCGIEMRRIKCEETQGEIINTHICRNSGCSEYGKEKITTTKKEDE